MTEEGSTMTTPTTAFDPAAYLDTEERRDGFLREALATNDAHHIAHAVGVVARASGMIDIAKATGKSRQSLYRSLDKGGNPTIDTIFGALEAMGRKRTLA
ncbi:addiction module antidote protein [uncultured Sphingomonas sp.]|uniref:addiction module antidote protein n=2 Tax=uncultured Sphingomonas sp. TaxID=158754 RepID=UPI0037495D36